MKRRAVLKSIPAAWLLAASGLAWAEDYPTKPVKIIVPFPPGGLTDQMARLVGQRLQESLKQSFLVDNRAGGGGQIGADAAAKAPADGYTLLAITLTHAANYSLFPKAPYNFVKDLRPVALMASSPMLIVVPAASPIKTLSDLAAAAKARQLNAGSSGNGTPPHLTLELYKDLTKLSLQHVPYKGGAPSMTDLIGGQLDVIFSNFPESYPHVKSGKLRALAISSPGRNPLVPDVPTTAEAGLPGLQVENWTGLMAPSGVATPIVQKVGAEVLKALATPDFEQTAKAQGFLLKPMGPDRFADFLKSEVERWGQIIKKAGIRPD